MDHPAFVTRGHQIITECMARAKAAELAHHKSTAVSTHVEECLRQLWAHMVQLAADLNPAAPPSPPFGVADPPSPRPIPEVPPVMGVPPAETFNPSRRDTKPRGIVPRTNPYDRTGGHTDTPLDSDETPIRGIVPRIDA